MRSPFSITKRPVGGGGTCMAVAGAVETATSDALREMILNALDAADLRELFIDLAGVSLLDSAGVAALIAGRNTAAQRGIGYQIRNYEHLVHQVR